MSYSDFLNLISNGFTLLIDTLSAWTSNLITNYFFITILGVGLFISFILFIFNDFLSFNILHRHEHDKDNQYN